ncbi:MAG: hypothetical protein NE327_23225 [Lentisphaeraceae bacterium]|nr:hypothetical protein [Lentisphaeraceae bacterium]
MKVKTYAFEIKRTQEKDLRNFFNRLKSDTNEFVTNGLVGKKVLRTHIIDDYIVGLLISLKDQKSFFKFKRGGFQIKKEDLEADESLMEFNFFLFSFKSKRGLYQEYHYSTHIESFCRILTDKHFKQVTKLRKKALDYDESRLSDEEIEELSNVDNIELVQPKPLVKEQDFLTIAASFKEISKYEYYVLEDDEKNTNKMYPEDSAYILSDQRVITFKRKGNILTSAKLSLVRKLFDVFSPQKGKIIGKNEKGHKAIASIDKSRNKTYFLEEEFDSLSEVIGSFALENFSTAKPIRDLYEIAENNQIFSQEP